MKRTDYDHTTIEGLDQNIETSLKEYGFAWIEGEDDYLIYYGIKIEENSGEYSRFDVYWIDKDIDIKKEYDWIDWDSINSFIGGNIMDDSLMTQYSNLWSYYGHLEIFGESYSEGLTYDQIIKEDEND